MSDPRSLLQRIPKVDRLLDEPPVASLRERLTHEALVGLIRALLAELREQAHAGTLAAEALAPGAIAERIAARAEAWLQPPLRRVINGTGILIHTNLGRAPLSPSSQQAVAQVLSGYSNLEMDLASGQRASRLARVRALLQRVCGAEDALAVNNNAAAVYLVLRVLADGREVVVARGELVEIGGSFRLPDIMRASGAQLREVGTTNRTRIGDYADAIGPRTGLILKVHPSNFVIEGFTESVSLGELARLAREREVPLLEDIGSGALAQHPRAYLREEPRVQASLRAGADLVSFSGDKLLGGPQAGILLGRAALIDAVRRDPLARVLRLDKLHLAALEATLLDYLRGDGGLQEIPLYRMMRRSVAELRGVAEGIAGELRDGLDADWRIDIVDTRAAAGGGSLPGETLASVGLEIRHPRHSPDALARRLRLGEPALVGRIERERLLLDLRSMTEEDWTLLGGLLIAHLSAADRGAQAQGD
ncbi:MAG: L-seryl-tRNA(Sec) selenium transferase [Candidatus Eisenbacteria bacterium]|nr:L-seryl-tRNA(Sec) selenium transferase [Candidatus Eisenbacteria bacterium]